MKIAFHKCRLRHDSDENLICRGSGESEHHRRKKRHITTGQGHKEVSLWDNHPNYNSRSNHYWSIRITSSARCFYGKKATAKFLEMDANASGFAVGANHEEGRKETHGLLWQLARVQGWSEPLISSLPTKLVLCCSVLLVVGARWAVHVTTFSK